MFADDDDEHFVSDVVSRSQRGRLIAAAETFHSLTLAIFFATITRIVSDPQSLPELSA